MVYVADALSSACAGPCRQLSLVFVLVGICQGILVFIDYRLFRVCVKGLHAACRSMHVTSVCVLVGWQVADGMGSIAVEYDVVGDDRLLERHPSTVTTLDVTFQP